MRASRVLLAVAILTAFNGCAYLKTVAGQSGYAVRHAVSPAQRNYKHMLGRETFFVFGKISYARGLNSEAIAVIALSNAINESEVVDVSYVASLDSYYGLNLPDGDYILLVVSDLDRDGYYDADEVVGMEEISLSLEAFPEKVVSGKHIDLASRESMASVTFRIPVVWTAQKAESLFYPRGSIRSLDDPVFSSQMATLGLYAPAKFLEAAPMMFYALEEDMPHKIPVVFVHGIGGSARDFDSIVAALDRSRFRPWFFYYPSGMDLDQLASMFHSVFLSGEVFSLGEMPMIIVAHSMGGLVARQAVNLQSNDDNEARVERLITIATPFGGHPAAKASHRAPVVIPSWRNLDPDSEFVQNMNRKPLAAHVKHHLIYAHNGEHPLESPDSNDGTVPLSSQLSAPAQEEATAVYGFEETHAGTLTNRRVIEQVMQIVSEVRSSFPELHMRQLVKGGYEVDLGSRYTALEAYYLQNYGAYMLAMATGAIQPVDPVQERFVEVADGQALPETELETAWVKFSQEFPDLLENPTRERRVLEN